MIIDNILLDSLLAQAKENPRLRLNYDLRTSESDTSQRMLNALHPGTKVPVHRHIDTSETVIILRGSIDVFFFNENGLNTKRFTLCHATGNVALQIPLGIWHTVDVKESCVILETKDGAFTPLCKDDLLEI